MNIVKVYFLNIEKLKGRKEFLYSVLPESRIEKAKRYAKETDRLLSLAAGYLINRVIGGFFVDEFGKPRSEHAFFSLSHSGELAALSLSETREIGIDIEKMRSDKDYDALAKFALNEKELESYKSCEHFLKLFTAKESLAKAEGRGLKSDVKTIPSLPVGGAVDYEDKTYYRHSLDVNGYFASVTQEGEDFIIETYDIEVENVT